MTKKPKTSGLSSAARPKRSPGRPRHNPDKTSENTRDILLDAAIELFAHYGYEPVTTGAVAKAAGLTQSMVHYHFGSKSKLWKAAVSRMMRRRGDIFRPAGDELIGLDPIEKLKWLTRRLIEANADDPSFMRIAIHEGMGQSPRLKWLVRNYVTVGFAVFDDAVRDAIKAGAIANMPVHDVTNAVTSAASLTFGLGAMIQELYGLEMSEAKHTESFSDTVIKILFDGLLTKSHVAQVRRAERKPASADIRPKRRTTQH